MQIPTRLRTSLSAARRSARTRPWQWLAAVICAVAGFMFATSANISHGTPIRSVDNTNLSDLVHGAEQRVNHDEAQVVTLQKQLQAATHNAGQENSAVGAAERQAQPLANAGGLSAVAGPGISVTLDDAKHVPDDPNVDLNQLVVHQSDLQSVVNALWAGGAEAMTVAGQRIVPTSAVRCVGNTLLLNDQVYSPPFTVSAIGPFQQMRNRLDQSPGVQLYRQAADIYGLRWTVVNETSLELPGFTGVVALSHAKAAK